MVIFYLWVFCISNTQKENYQCMLHSECNKCTLSPHPSLFKLSHIQWQGWKQKRSEMFPMLLFSQWKTELNSSQKQWELLLSLHNSIIPQLTLSCRQITQTKDKESVDYWPLGLGVWEATNIGDVQCKPLSQNLELIVDFQSSCSPIVLAVLPLLFFPHTFFVVWWPPLLPLKFFSFFRQRPNRR